MPRERTKPPTTAVKRVDFFLQNVMTSGERRRETPKHNPDKQPRINKKVEKIDTLFYPKLVESYVTIMCRNCLFVCFIYLVLKHTFDSRLSQGLI